MLEEGRQGKVALRLSVVTRWPLLATVHNPSPCYWLSDQATTGVNVPGERTDSSSTSNLAPTTCSYSHSTMPFSLQRGRRKASGRERTGSGRRMEEVCRARVSTSSNHVYALGTEHRALRCTHTHPSIRSLGGALPPSVSSSGASQPSLQCVYPALILFSGARACPAWCLEGGASPAQSTQADMRVLCAHRLNHKMAEDCVPCARAESPSSPARPSESETVNNNTTRSATVV